MENALKMQWKENFSYLNLTHILKTQCSSIKIHRDSIFFFFVTECGFTFKNQSRVIFFKLTFLMNFFFNQGVFTLHCFQLRIENFGCLFTQRMCFGSLNMLTFENGFQSVVYETAKMQMSENGYVIHMLIMCSV